ncbi:MAG: translational GTPase TypA [Proteobacteria bacterium]|nr:translational GTPase TypA [Pseudomonadota bacterium]
MILRNIAIIAHVDHGKTTLVDSLLRQSGAVASHQVMAERALDSGDLERERGITILAKCTSVTWGEVRINIVDTPGHADFGGEVERILHMVDGVLLLVDAAEGPMPQTKFVTAKALALGLKPIVVINKVDRSDAEPEKAQESVFDLFAALEATDEQLDFPTLFAAARDGWASREPGQKGTTLAPLIETIISHVPPPVADPDAPFALLATILEYDPYLGRVLTGRIHSGRVKTNMAVHALSRGAGEVEQGRITRILAFRGLERVPVAEAEAGDIVALAGLSKATVADTIASPESFAAITAIPVEPPTLAMTFSVNDSPLAGRDGTRLTSRVLRDRLLREAEGNVAIRVTETGEKDAFEVAGRGELQLGVLIEQLRRDGFELSISRPRVLYRTDPETGERLEPIEEVQVDVDEPYSGTVVESISQRRGEMTALKPSGGGKVRLTFRVPSRGMIGYHGQFLTDTRGTGILSSTFHGFEPHRGPIEGRRTGVLISNAQGRSVAYALWNLEERGALFIDPGIDIYAGMIIGEHNRGSDLEVNPLKAKQLTNIRAAGKDEAIRLTPPVRMSLEQAIAYIDDDELVEVTPKAVRLRKRLLDPNERKRSERQSQA